jgi:hypothetical protein
MGIEEVFWEMLPPGLQGYFELEGYQKDTEHFRIVLVERNELIDIPEQYRGKKVIDNSLNSITVEDFPLRGRKAELILKRRSWKFEGVDQWYRRDIQITAPGTKLEKEFALFLKELDRECSRPD